MTDDCLVGLDLDQTCFVAAAGAEERSIKVTHIKSGREKTFKNRKEFWGLTKNVVGGWIKDQNANREVLAKAEGREFTPWVRDDFSVEDIQTPEPVEFCLQILKTKVDGIMNHLGLENGLGVLGGDNNFRLLLPAPEQYKSNREDKLRPLLLQDTREYVKKKYNAVVIDKMEADDYLSTLGYEGWLHYQKTGRFNKMIVSYDKDQRGTPGLIFNTLRDKDKATGKSKWIHPVPMLIDDSMGEIWMEGSKVTGWGKKFLGYQMLCGDSSDNIKPYQCFDIIGRFGDTAAFKLIGHLNDEREMWSAIVGQYKTWFPNGVKFTSWDGTQRGMSAGQWASVIFQMVYMKRSPNDRTTLSTVLKGVGLI